MNSKLLSHRSLAVVLTTILLLVSIPVTAVFASSAGPNTAGTAITDGGAGGAWTAPSGNLVSALSADDGTTASVTISSASNGAESLNMTNFGFSIPTTATITGIEVEINRWASTGTGARDETIRLLRGSAVGDNKASATDWSADTSSVVTYGNSTDLWGTTWTPAQINNSNFGVTLDVDRDNSGDKIANVDYVRITVTYKETPTLSVANSPVTYNGSPQAATVTGSVPGTVSDVKYDGSSTVPTNAGTYAITVDFVPDDTANYNSLSDASAGNFVIAKADQATLVAVVTPSTVTYGSTADLTTTGGSGSGAVTFSAGASTGCSVSGTTLSVTNASGTCEITATKAADTNYNVATSAAAPVTLQKAATTTTVTGGTFTYDGAAHAATVSVTGPGGLNLTPSASYSGSCSAAPITVAEGTTCTASYNYAGNNNYLASSDLAGITINQKDASVTPAAASKTYGAADPALTGNLTGFIPGDNVTATYSRVPGETVAGSPYTISAELSPAGVLPNYNITYNTADFTINAKAASVTPAAASKTYGDADPALTGTLSGFLPADNVTATYSRTPGETVAGSPYTISAVLGPAGVLSNYNITYNTAEFTINAKAASVTPDAASKTYGAADPTLTGTLTGFLPADNVTATYSRTAGETVAGSPYTISAVLSPVGVLSNYSITNNTANFTITPRNLTITGLTANDKPYDGNTTATLSGTATLVGVVGADDVTLGGTPVATFADPNVGNNKPVTVTGFTLGGADAGNYSLTQPAGLTASITGASVTVTGITANNKVYDGNTTATLNTGSAVLVGVVPGDDVNLDTSAAAGAFADKNVGTGKTVTISGLALTGADAGKYLLIQPTTTANITARDLTVSAAGVNKVYDGTTAATVTLSSDALVGDVVTFTYTAAFTDPNVGNGKTVNVSAISVGGTDAGNYNLLNTTANTTANITQAPLTVTANNHSKTIGQPDPTFTFSYSGFVNGETSAVLNTPPTCGVSVPHSAAGTYPIECSGGVDDNYSFSYVNGTLTVNAVMTQTFDDVPTTYWAWEFVERLYSAGITGGCGVSPLIYCPDGSVTRAQMAVFLLRGIHGSSYTPPAVGGSTGFADVSTSYWAAAWIKQLAVEGITGGCGNGNYCPDSPVTRAQMAVFLLKSKHGASYAPPDVGGSTGFGDVSTSYWAGAWIKQLVTEGITAGCGNGNYCPESPVTRAQMAVFLVRTFNLP